MNEKGRVEDAIVVQEHLATLFSNAALVSVRSSVYQPKQVDCVAVPVVGKQRKVEFLINGKSANDMPLAQRDCNNSAPDRLSERPCKKLN